MYDGSVETASMTSWIPLLLGDGGVEGSDTFCNKDGVYGSGVGIQWKMVSRGARCLR